MNRKKVVLLVFGQAEFKYSNIPRLALCHFSICLSPLICHASTITNDFFKSCSEHGFVHTLLTVAALPGKTACNMYNLFFLFTYEPLTSHFGTICSHTPTTVPFSPSSSLMQRDELYFVDNLNPFLHLNSIVSLY